MYDFIDKINNINYYISSRNTGCPKDFAEKIRVSERMMYEYLKLLKYLGAPIRYCKTYKTYYYEIKGSVEIKFYNKA